MSSIRWADRISCDYPGCESTADAVAPPLGTFDREAPPGWLSMGGRSPITMMTAFGQNISDLCSLHSSIPIDQLYAAFAPKEANANGNSD